MSLHSPMTVINLAEELALEITASPESTPAESFARVADLYWPGAMVESYEDLIDAYEFATGTGVARVREALEELALL